jgi:hypothetical protein
MNYMKKLTISVRLSFSKISLRQSRKGLIVSVPSYQDDSYYKTYLSIVCLAVTVTVFYYVIPK